MEKEERVYEYIARMEYIHSQLQDVGDESIGTSALLGKIVSGLPRRYMSFISSWTNLEPAKQTMVELMNRLGAEEQLLNRFWKPKVVEQAFLTEGEERKGRARRVTKHEGQQDSSKMVQFAASTSKKEKEGSGKKNWKCWNCLEKGHFKHECPMPKKDKPNSSKKVGQKKSKSKDLEDSEDEQKEEGGNVAEEANIVEKGSEWTGDTAATSSMTGQMDDFIPGTFQKFESARMIKFGGQHGSHAIGSGLVKLTSVIEGKRVGLELNDVLLVPGLRRRLISISKAADSGLIAEVTKDKLVLRDSNGNKKLICQRRSNLYLASVEHEEAMVAVEEELEVWHERFGHINKRYLINTAQAVLGLNSLKGAKCKTGGAMDTIDCLGCCLGKQQKHHIPRRETPRATEIGEMLHLDIGGPVGAKSLSGCEYYILFKDEYSNYRFVAVMKSRDEAFDHIRKVVAQIKADTKQSVRYIMSDCGSEFTSKRSQEFFLENKIVHKTAAPFTPAQNGFIERDNKTLMSAVRSMLHHRKAPMELWGEAAKTSVYLLNRSINSNTKDITPYEMYFKKQPKVDHLKIFGCLAMIKIQQKKRSGYQKKLEERAKKGVFVGYEQNFTYRIYVPEEKKVIITRDVIFDESKNYDEALQTNYRELDKFIDEQYKELEVGEASEGEEEAEVAEASTLEPSTYREAIACDDKDLWKDAMDSEYASLIKNKTWELVEVPMGRRIVTCRWVYALKYNSDGSVARYKARLVARGFTQIRGVDFDKTYSPVVRLDSIRIMLVLANNLNLNILQFDVKTAFLYGSLDEEVYMTQPEGYVRGKDRNGKQLVCKLKKSLYGLRQASRQWNVCFTEFLRTFALSPLKSDCCIFVNNNCDVSDVDRPLLVVCIYVDDGLILSNRPALMEECIKHLCSKFEITLGEPDTYVGLRIKRDIKKRVLSIDQTLNVRRMLEKFGLSKAKVIGSPMDSSLKLTKDGQVGVNSVEVDVPYRQLIGCLNYVANGTRPDISYAVNKLSRYCCSPKLVHWEALKRVAKYLVSRESYGLHCKVDVDEKNKVTLVCYSDSDYGGCLDDCKSTSGYVIYLNGMPVIWRATKQKVVATSTCEAEFISATLVATLWVRNFLRELGVKLTATTHYIDNQSAIALKESSQVHAKTKHLDIPLHFIRDVNNVSKLIKVVYISTEEQIGDILTKALPRYKHCHFVEKLGLVDTGKFWEISEGEEANCAVEMKSAINIPVLLLSQVIVSGGYLLGPKYSIEPHTVVMSYGRVCEYLITEDLGKELLQISKFAEREKTARRRIAARSLAAYQWEHCMLRLEAVVRTLERLPDVARTLTKRSIVDDIYKNAIELPRVVVSSATLWLKGIAKRVVLDTAEGLAIELLKVLFDLGRELYHNNTLVPFATIRNGIKDVSVFAGKREQLLDKHVEIMNPTLTFLRYVDAEMSAAEVLLGSIYASLMEGKLDTQALGELIESVEIMSIDPIKTRIRSIKQNGSKNSAQFVFDVIEELNIGKRIIWMDVITILGSLGITGVICFIYYLYKTAAKKIKEANVVQINVQHELEQLNKVSGKKTDGDILETFARQMNEQMDQAAQARGGV